MHRFDRPAAAHQTSGEVVEQFRMRGRLAVAQRLTDMALEISEAVQRLALARLEAEIAAVGAAGESEAVEAPAPASRQDDPVARIDRALPQCG